MSNKYFYFFIIIVTLLSVAINSNADSICKDMTSGDADEVDTKLLALIDNLLKKWPQHEKLKKITKRNEQLEHWKDARQRIIVECERGDEFSAGFALGHDLAMYKMMLLNMSKQLESIP